MNYHEILILLHKYILKAQFEMGVGHGMFYLYLWYHHPKVMPTTPFTEWLSLCHHGGLTQRTPINNETTRDCKSSSNK